jgi:hypothetical protein
MESVTYTQLKYLFDGKDIVHDILKNIKNKPGKDPRVIMINALHKGVLLDMIRFQILRDIGVSIHDKVFDACCMGYAKSGLNPYFTPTVREQELFSFLEYSIDMLREDVYRLLSEQLGGDHIVFVKNYLDGGGQKLEGLDVSELKHSMGRIFVKKPYRRNKSSVFLPPYVEAVRRFVDIPPHPNILSIHEYDEKTGDSWQERQSFVTIRDILSQKKSRVTKYISCADVMHGFTDAVIGAEYLDMYGLVLQDINLSNIGISLMDRRGILFDLEGLSMAGRVIGGRLSDKRYFLPETDSSERGGRFAIPIASTEMVYQFGVSLKILLSHRRFYIIGEARDILLSLSKKMTNIDSFDRPTLSSIRTTLTSLCSINLDTDDSLPHHNLSKHEYISAR